jgi:hypothetical protein
MTTSTDRQQYRELVADIAAKAKAKLPQAVNGRIEKAVSLVLQGDVEPQDNGTVVVFSATDATRRYVLQGTSCTCADYERGQAPEGWCAHRIAAGIAKRVGELLPAPAVQGSPGNLETSPAPVGPLPEAPVSITLKASLHGHEVLVTLRGTDFASVQAQVEQASAWLRSQAPAQGPTADGWCSIHNMPMKDTTKNGQTWRSHKTADGWCKGK